MHNNGGATIELSGRHVEALKTTKMEDFKRLILLISIESEIPEICRREYSNPIINRWNWIVQRHSQPFGGLPLDIVTDFNPKSRLCDSNYKPYM